MNIFVPTLVSTLVSSVFFVYGLTRSEGCASWKLWYTGLACKVFCPPCIGPKQQNTASNAITLAILPMATLLSTPPRLADGLGSKGITPLQKGDSPQVWFPRIRLLGIRRFI